MSADSHEHETAGESFEDRLIGNDYLSPEDLKESLRDVRFGPRASRVAQGVLRQLKKLEEAIKQDNRFGDEPPVGSVVAFTKHFEHSMAYRDHERPAGDYTYVALRTEAGWFLTGRHQTVKTWDWIVDFSDGAPIRLSHTSEWDEL